MPHLLQPMIPFWLDEFFRRCTGCITQGGKEFGFILSSCVCLHHSVREQRNVVYIWGVVARGLLSFEFRVLGFS